jgi:hypothetical protein
LPYLTCGIIEIAGDADGDGVVDEVDIFPNDSSEQYDSDSDGVGDNADAFPNDANESSDSDMDGIGDNADAFPNDPSKSILEEIDNSKVSEDTPSLSFLLSLSTILLAGILHRKRA